jgi:hypothetical protein
MFITWWSLFAILLRHIIVNFRGLVMMRINDTPLESTRIVCSYSIAQSTARLLQCIVQTYSNPLSCLFVHPLMDILYETGADPMARSNSIFVCWLFDLCSWEVKAFRDAGKD